MNIHIVYYTNKGDVRNNNEDSLLINKEIINDCTMDSFVDIKLENAQTSILTIADGMGGYEKGELASKIVLANLIESKSEDDILINLKSAKIQLNKIVKENSSLYGMGATLAGIIVSNEELTTFNMGDCRCYREYRGFLEKITKDHSNVQVLFDLGEISEDEMRTHKNKNIVTSALSGDNKEEIDNIYFKNIKKKNNQRFLICSDGLWEILSIEEMEECFSENTINSIALKIIEKTTNKVKNDNLSFIIFETE